MTESEIKPDSRPRRSAARRKIRDGKPITEASYQNCHRIGITGSIGKTSAKEFLFDLLSCYEKGLKSPDSFNTLQFVRRLLKQRETSDSFIIAEIGASGPGTLNRPIKLLRPTVGVVTCVRNDHYTSFRGVENVWQEKVKLVRALTADGIAVLNQDDDRVVEMREHAGCRVVTYGRNPDAEVRAERVESKWPARLSFDLITPGGRWRVNTGLTGHVQLSSLLAAFAVIHALGHPMEPAVHAAAEFVSYRYRMEVVEAEGGVTYIRDDYKAPEDSAIDAIEFLNQASAKRKLLVLGKLSDYSGKENKKVRRLLDMVAEDVEKVIVVHPRSEVIMRKLVAARPSRYEAYSNARSASRRLAEITRDGDLILLKSGQVARLERILLDSPATPVQCDAVSCERLIQCDRCYRLYASQAVINNA